MSEYYFLFESDGYQSLLDGFYLQLMFYTIVECTIMGIFYSVSVIFGTVDFIVAFFISWGTFIARNSSSVVALSNIRWFSILILLNHLTRKFKNGAGTYRQPRAKVVRQIN